MVSFTQFTQLKRYECTLEYSLYSYLNDWVIYIVNTNDYFETEVYKIYTNPIKDESQIFHNFKEAEEFLYDLYCKELSLTEGY